MENIQDRFDMQMGRGILLKIYKMQEGSLVVWNEGDYQEESVRRRKISETILEAVNL